MSSIANADMSSNSTAIIDKSAPMNSLSGPASSGPTVQTQSSQGGSGNARQKEIYRFEAPWPIYAMHWSMHTELPISKGTNKPLGSNNNNNQNPGGSASSTGMSSGANPSFRLALGSFIEEYCNRVMIVMLDENSGEFVSRSTFDHPYPTTKIMFIPDSKGTFPDILATSGDYLRIWRCASETETRLECLLNNNKNSDFCAPLTSFDWNELDLGIIGTCSIDTTCTIWGIETGQAIGQVSLAGGGSHASKSGTAGAGSSLVNGHVKTQLIAHDKEVYDMAFSHSHKDLFASVGADGSLRLFDLRHLEHSTILYEDMGTPASAPQPTAPGAPPALTGRRPLLRLGWNRHDMNYLATFALEAPNEPHELVLLDIRVPCTPVAKLRNHRAPLNSFCWAPHSSVHLATAADDHQALIWDISAIPRAIEDPILAYTAGGPINQLFWSPSQTDWISVCFGNTLEILRV